MVKDAIIGSIGDLLQFVRDIIQTMKDKTLEIIGVLKDLMKPVLEFLSDLKDSFIDWFRNIIDTILDIPTAIKDVLIALFVPANNPFHELKAKVESKFPIVNQIASLIGAVVFSGSGGAPVFNITYAGHTVSIVDFDTFLPYMGVMHLIIIAICYYRFLKRLYRRLPSIIGGFNT